MKRAVLFSFFPVLLVVLAGCSASPSRPDETEGRLNPPNTSRGYARILSQMRETGCEISQFHVSQDYNRTDLQIGCK